MPTFNQDDWVTPNIKVWQHYVLPVAREFQNKGPICWLEIGSFEGRSALWVYENVIRSDVDELTCVDIWERAEIEKTFDANTNGLKIVKRKEPSFNYLRKDDKKIHVAYIDGSHDAPRVLEDAVLVYRRLVPGGVIIFDDYLWEQPRDRAPAPLPPRPAIDGFIAANLPSLRVLYKGWQVIVQKLSAS